MTEALARTRHTEPQWELNLTERRKNIKGAFAVTRPELVKGKYILLVDDIFTSGTTMDECAKVLKKAGAVTVKGLALASGAR
jgi:predicted amidophosphoribosyltransferase